MALDIGRRRLARALGAAANGGGRSPTVTIVGAGMSGLGLGMQLARAGCRSFTIVEQSAGVGGTWRDNTYPGSGCDVPSHLYSFSFAPKRDWSRRFAEQAEILGYAEHCVEAFGLAPHLRLRTTVEDARFDEETGTWSVTVVDDRGHRETLRSDVVVFACGQLNQPFVPDLPGLDRFDGPQWHSARWDHDVDLTGKRVAVVGCGASAIQFVPPVAEVAAQTTVFQRTVNYVAPKSDRAYGPAQRWLFGHLRAYELTYRWWIYWSLEARWFAFRQNSWAGRSLRSIMVKGIRAGVVSDRLPDDVVVPDYPVGCRRILISNDWYPAIMRPDVHVVGEAIDHVEPDGVVTVDGTRHSADVLVFGTGFRATDFLRHIPITGRGGRTLGAAWQGGAHAYLGVAVADFPNCFLLYGPNTNLGHNSILFMVERQLNLVLQSLAALTEQSTTIEVSDEAYGADDARIQDQMRSTPWVAACHSWYKTATGRVTNNWPTWTVRYWYDTLRLRPDALRVAAHRPSSVTGGTAASATARGTAATPTSAPAR